MFRRFFDDGLVPSSYQLDCVSGVNGDTLCVPGQGGNVNLTGGRSGWRSNPVS